ncbi:hypothetical protein niasHT_033836 [Heterodera trifolii]|uniref:Ubiquitin-like domain-containing protein n=1 Tax=Heterodera trifolii TaxID=157864 RepID=A0ABD2I4Y1_9BILA
MTKCRIEKGNTVDVSWKEFPITVNYNDKVINLKEKIKAKIGIPPEKQRVIYSADGQQFIVDEPSYDRILIYGFYIFVFGLIMVKGTDTVATMKEKIRTMIKTEKKINIGENIKLSKRSFNYQNVEELKDDKTMDDCGIKTDVKIYMKTDEEIVSLVKTSLKTH